MRLLSLNSGAIKIEGRATPWNKGKLLGPPLKLKEVTIRRRVIASDWCWKFGWNSVLRLRQS
jgi:hypothetical protein